MKKSSLKKVLGIILFFTLLFTVLSSTVSARYQYIAILSVGFQINSSGLAEFDGCVDPSNSNTKTDLTVELQKKSGSTWNNDGSWSASGTGTNTILKSVGLYVVHGTYRVVVTAKVYSSSSGALLETEDITSREVTY